MIFTIANGIHNPIGGHFNKKHPANKDYGFLQETKAKTDFKPRGVDVIVKTRRFPDAPLSNGN